MCFIVNADGIKKKKKKKVILQGHYLEVHSFLDDSAPGGNLLTRKKKKKLNRGNEDDLAGWRFTPLPRCGKECGKTCHRQRSWQEIGQNLPFHKLREAW